MSALYLETSAVATWLFSEERGADVRAAVDSARQVATSSLTLTEAERALVRAEVSGRLRSGDGQRLRGMLQRAQIAWLKMSIPDEILGRACMPFPVEPVRTLDAIHLATALAFARTLPDIRVLSLDRRILQNAEALGIG